MKKEKVAITSIGGQGDGIATHAGKPVYVPKTAPGDIVTVSLDKESKDDFTAKLLTVEAQGPERVPAPCSYFETCGGCALQHVSEAFYRAWKIENVKATLARAGVRVEKWDDPIFLPAATRRRTSLSVVKTAKGIVFGYNEARSHSVLDIRKCLVLEPELDDLVQNLRPYLPRLLGDCKAIDIMLQRAGGAIDMVLTGPLAFGYAQDEAIGDMAEKLDIARVSYRKKDFARPEVLLTRKPVVKHFGALRVELPPAAFLQASAAGENALATLVKNHAKDARSAADLFSGCGLFSGVLLEAGAKVYAAENDAAALTALKAARHDAFTVEGRDLFKNPLAPSVLNTFDMVVFDPPRAGAMAQAVQLSQSQVACVTGISCNPATFARDAKILQEGGYRLTSLTVIDQFVWSAHVEISAVFKR